MLLIELIVLSVCFRVLDLGEEDDKRVKVNFVFNWGLDIRDLMVLCLLRGVKFRCCVVILVLLILCDGYGICVL